MWVFKVALTLQSQGNHRCMTCVVVSSHSHPSDECQLHTLSKALRTPCLLWARLHGELPFLRKTANTKQTSAPYTVRFKDSLSLLYQTEHQKKYYYSESLFPNIVSAHLCLVKLKLTLHSDQGGLVPYPLVFLIHLIREFEFGQYSGAYSFINILKMNILKKKKCHLYFNVTLKPWLAEKNITPPPPKLLN